METGSSPGLVPIKCPNCDKVSDHSLTTSKVLFQRDKGGLTQNRMMDAGRSQAPTFQLVTCPKCGTRFKIPAKQPPR